MSGGGATTGAEAVCQMLKIPGSDTGKVVAAFPFTFDVGRLFVDRKSQLVSIAFSNGIGKLETLSFPTKAFLKAYKDQLIVAQQGQNKPKEGNPLRREGQTYNLSQKYPESLGIRILDELLRVILHIIYPVEN
jgi:hypothetical protein